MREDRWRHGGVGDGAKGRDKRRGREGGGAVEKERKVENALFLKKRLI